MDDLIIILIKLLAGLFGGEGKSSKGPGFPNVPPRRPTVSRPTGLLPPDTMREIRQRMTPARAPAKKPAAKKPPVRVMAPPALPVSRPMAAPAVVERAPAPVAAKPKRPAAEIDAAALRRWLRPAVLHNQFILSEIFQPPITLREERW